MTHPSILVVDDEPDLRTLMDRILKRRGYDVRTAAGVEEARAALDAYDEPPDLVITDISMPDGRGLDLAEEVHKRYAGEVDVIFVSGYNRDRAVAEGLINADSNLLEKPFNPSQLAETVEAALRVH